MQDSQVGRVMYEEDELVWLGSESAQDDHPVEVHEVTVLDKEEWDCPTDILYHHAESEDHVRPIPVQRDQVDTVTVKLQQVKIQQDDHPMFAFQPYNTASLRAVKEPYDPSTWESPTDILNYHAEYELPSALGLHVPPQVCSPSPLNLPMQPKQRNAFGVPREPYNAETWDSPTDILYAHGKEEDGEEVYKKERSSSEIDSPYTPYSAFVSTPVEGMALLPDLDRASEGGSKVMGRTADEDFIVRAGRRLAETIHR